jgi:sugar phosphate permease
MRIDPLSSTNKNAAAMIYLIGSLVGLIIAWAAWVWIRDRPSRMMLAQAEEAYKAGSSPEAEKLLLRVIDREKGPTSLNNWPY